MWKGGIGVEQLNDFKAFYHFIKLKYHDTNSREIVSTLNIGKYQYKISNYHIFYPFQNIF